MFQESIVTGLLNHKQKKMCQEALQQEMLIQVDNNGPAYKNQIR
jgi:hypothetical protein